ncbi:serine hydrolase [Phaeobacter sp. J2-8]|uniref:serine hydrolase domain-containing protein n=1 Tax=Phaeobacter sp. J2-8 TaxID=2931394 RepID=UPI001FCFF345|nr:serine hydrolase [Phaeobacter sp. J2-8]MCJ7874705.1 serine hydrolase [Phaeobacter sp. J2-8]
MPLESGEFNELDIPVLSWGAVHRRGGAAIAEMPVLNFEAAASYSKSEKGSALLARVGGQTVFEVYGNGATSETAALVASVNKSFWGLVLAAMVQDGLAELNEPVALTIHEWADDPLKSQITVDQLLSLTAGLDGVPLGPGPVETYAESLAAPSLAAPGERFHYRPSSFQVFGEWARRKLDPDHPHAVSYLQDRLFDPLDIEPERWPTETDGFPRMPSSAFLTATELATWGEFVLTGGAVDGKQLVDPDAFAAVFTPVSANPAYGLGWWLLSDEPIDAGAEFAAFTGDFLPVMAARDDIPDEFYVALGGNNTRIYVVPDWDFVLVRMEATPPPPPSAFDDKAFWHALLSAN